MIKVFKEIFFGPKELSVSQFAYETLMIFIKANRLEGFYNACIENSITLRSSNTAQSGGYKSNNGVKNIDYDHFKNINDSKINLGPLEEDQAILKNWILSLL